MKFCYIDESGTGNEPFAVMSGVIVDAQRMHVTKNDWADLLEQLSTMTGNQITEIHTRDFYPGNGPWRGLNGQLRAQIITAIFNWIEERHHHIVYSVVDKNLYFRDFPNEPFAANVPSLWQFMALHISLSIQKHFQREQRNKGNTILIFDRENTEEADFTALIRNPPTWTDTYYGLRRNIPRLNQIIDAPYFGDSEHVGLIQLADFVSFFLRRYVELQNGNPPRYPDETVRIQGWMETLMSRSIQKSSMYPSNGRCACAELFYKYAPTCITR